MFIVSHKMLLTWLSIVQMILVGAIGKRVQDDFNK